LRQHGIVVAGSAIATLGALIVAKVVLIADRIPLLNLYPRKPLMYNVILKTFVFSLVTLLFIVLEEAFSAGAGTGGFSSALRKMSEDISWEAFWLREIWLFVLIAFYCAASELVRVVGWEKVREILFGRAK
jgi:hypothetical protein